MSSKSSFLGFVIVAYLVLSPILIGYLVYENCNKASSINRLEAKIAAEKDMKELDTALVDFEKSIK